MKLPFSFLLAHFESSISHDLIFHTKVQNYAICLKIKTFRTRKEESQKFASLPR